MLPSRCRWTIVTVAGPSFFYSAIALMLRGLVSILCRLAVPLARNGSDAGAGPVGALAPRDLPFFYDLYTFRSDGGGTTVVAAVAVPVRRLRAERVEGRVRYRFDLRFVLADTARLSVFSTIDSVFVSAPRALAGQHLLHTYVEVDAGPSAATVRSDKGTAGPISLGGRWSSGGPALGPSPSQ